MNYKSLFVSFLMLFRNPMTDWLLWQFQFFYWLVKGRGRITLHYLARTRSTNLAEPCTIGTRSTLRSVTLASHSYVAADTHIQNAVIGRYCSIGIGCRIGLGQHPSQGFISTHPAFFSTQQQAGFSYVDQSFFEETKTIKIGNDVWIGAGAIIHDGITIGDGAIIAAGAVVVKDVLPYHIVGGVPARTIRVRYSDEEISMLIRFAWWNRSEDWLRKNASLFADERKFIESIKNQ